MGADVRKSLKKFLPRLLEARQENLGEADTVQHVVKLFEEVLGYDPLEDLTRDKAVRGEFVDLAVRLDHEIPVLIEVVSAATPLQVAHIEVARQAAARDNVPFILLTNGLAFNLYHVTLDEDLGIALVFTTDLSRGVSDDAARLLGVLHRKSVAKGGLVAFWEQRSRLGPSALARALFHPDTLEALRGRLHAQEGIWIDVHLLAAALHEMLDPAARRRIGPIDPGAAPPSPTAADAAAPHVVDAPTPAPHVVEPSE